MTSQQSIPRARLTDVAKLADVSTTTASYVMGAKRDLISDSTAQRVLAAARRLRYRPNGLARSLRQRASKSIGLISPALPNGYVVDVIRAIYEEAQLAGYHVLLEPHEGQEPADQSKALANLLDRMVDGMFVFWPSQPWAFREEVLVPTVLIDTPESTHVPQGASRVEIDRYSGILEATEHLIHSGRRNIALVVQEADDQITRDKIRGWQDAHLRANRQPQFDLLVRLRDPEWTIAEGFELSPSLVSRPNRPDAVIVTDDTVATGVIKKLLAMNLRVPQDIAVIGFIGLDLCLAAPVELATVSFPRRRIAREAVGMMLELLGNHERDYQPRSVVLPMDFIKRDSCK
ncbi:MAG: LacI family DNA-binding transcriptional regulator [Phycisphaeraceae bacterium]